MVKKITVSFELLDSEDDTYRELMDNFVNQPNDKGIKVYAVTRGCLHEKVEQIEGILDNPETIDLYTDIITLLEQA